MNDELLSRYAALVVDAGVNLQPGMDLHVFADVGHAPLARALVRAAYGAGARMALAHYGDQHVVGAQIELAPEDALGWVPAWQLERMRSLVDVRASMLSIANPPEPQLFDGLDQGRVARAHDTALRALSRELIGEISWTVVVAPTLAWSQTVFGAPDLPRLDEAFARCLRLDEEDPSAAWHTRLAELRAQGLALDALELDAVRFHGPGTDLTVGLLPGARWLCADMTSSLGHTRMPNLPTEEIFTTPDPTRTQGHFTATRPLVRDGVLIEGIRLRFEDGVVVEAAADAGEELLLAQLDRDAGARRLGEVALVDGSSRIGQTGLVYYDSLLDENATCHVAYGIGYTDPLPDHRGKARAELGVNESAIHTDVMLGGPAVDVDGVLRDGTVVPLLRAEAWQV